jgi:hypothetical protein
MTPLTICRPPPCVPDTATLLSDLTPPKCDGYYEALRTRVDETGKVYAVDSHRNMLAEARSLLKFARDASQRDRHPRGSRPGRRRPAPVDPGREDRGEEADAPSPPVLQPYLAELTSGKTAKALIFGQHWRDWVRKWVRTICEDAKVPLVSAHSMRGLHSTLAIDAGSRAKSWLRPWATQRTRGPRAAPIASCGALRNPLIRQAPRGLQ